MADEPPIAAELVQRRERGMCVTTRHAHQHGAPKADIACSKMTSDSAVESGSDRPIAGRAQDTASLSRRGPYLRLWNLNDRAPFPPDGVARLAEGLTLRVRRNSEERRISFVR